MGILDDENLVKRHRIRACVNCRYFVVVEDAEEIEGLGDTSYIKTRCRLLERESREYYAFPRGEREFVIDEKPGECPLWEPWDEETSDGGERMSESVIQRVRVDAEEFIAELMGEYYRHFSGQKDSLEIGPVYEKFNHLFSEELTRESRDAIDGKSGQELTAARNLHSFLMGTFISNQVKHLTEELMNHQSTLSIEAYGEKTGYHGIIPRIRNEDDSSKREGIFRKWMNLETDELNPRRLKIWETQFGIIKDEGYEGYIPFVEFQNGLEYQPIMDDFQRFLDVTRDVYIRSMDEISREYTGIPLTEASVWDKDYFLKGGNYDAAFSKDALVPAVEKMFVGLGLDLDSVDAIVLDIEDRENKRPRAFCAAVRPGKEVYVVTRPMGGRQDYGSLLHELGHGCHYAFCDLNLPFELRFFGDRAISEGFAFLFNYLYNDVNWLMDYLGVSESDANDMVKFGMANKLFMLRRYIAKLKYEMRLFTDWDISSRADEYSNVLTDELVVKHYPNAYLHDLDAGFYSADYLRAWFWEVQLRAWLKSEYGDRWYANHDCLGKLKEMWGWGQMYSPDEMARKLGMDGLSIDPAIDEINNWLMD